MPLTQPRLKDYPMKKIICVVLTMLLPMLALAQDAKKEPKKETINSHRVFAKDGHENALKAALAAHAQKFHTGNWKWRVSQVLSGPDEGAYMIVEGPISWTDFDGRGDLGAEHQKDYETTIAPHVEKSTPSTYSTLEADASTVAAGAWSPTKTLIRHIYIKPGRASHMLDTLKMFKKVWEKRGQNVAVWNTFYSGEPSFTLAFRLKNGWKDLDEDMMTVRKAADEVLGAGSYDRLLEEVAMDTEHVVDEMIEAKPDLGSK
jgi:hypothetical protein